MSLPTLKDTSVIYVEDEILIALDGEEILRGMGFGKICVCHSLRDASAVIERQDFHLALLDINLGGGDTSFGIAESLRAKGTRLLFTSGYNVSEGLAAPFGAQMISKPFDEIALRTAIRRVAGWAED